MRQERYLEAAVTLGDFPEEVAFSQVLRDYEPQLMPLAELAHRSHH